MFLLATIASGLLAARLSPSSKPPAKDHAIRALYGSCETSATKAIAYGNAEKVLALAKLKSARVPMLA